MHQLIILYIASSSILLFSNCRSHSVSGHNLPCRFIPGLRNVFDHCPRIFYFPSIPTATSRYQFPGSSTLLIYDSHFNNSLSLSLSPYTV
ncbi:hypothetical protein F4810DRAFT_672184 [Camillea tinctor]|nr:hypothetical protein F4810DRAFT_672184 [Camillea tinctor]